jgi:pantothenate kinase
MDGFHFPNEYLDSHFRPLSDGTKIPLAWVKGQPDTIDTKALRKALKMLAARPHEMDWPGYSRRTHDVVPNMYVVHESANLVFVDGNYLLLNRGDFAGIPDLFDLRMYLEAPAASILSNLMERHMRGGKSVEQAKDWVKRIDLPNARTAEGTRFNADVIIQRNTEDDISEIRWKGEVLQPEKTDATGTKSDAARQQPPVKPPPAATNP